jgi:hypothetical protein
LPTKTTQIECLLFSRPAKDFGIATKSTVFCPAAQRKILECASTAFGSAVQRKFWNLPEKQLKLTAFCPKI